MAFSDRQGQVRQLSGWAGAEQPLLVNSQLLAQLGMLTESCDFRPVQSDADLVSQDFVPVPMEFKSGSLDSTKPEVGAASCLCYPPKAIVFNRVGTMHSHPYITPAFGLNGRKW
jgi:hypothetical protein